MGNYMFRPCPTVPLTPGTSHVERLLVSAWGVNKAVLGGSLVYVSLFTSHIYGVTGPSFYLRPAPT